MHTLRAATILTISSLWFFTTTAGAEPIDLSSSHLTVNSSGWATTGSAITADAQLFFDGRPTAFDAPLNLISDGLISSITILPFMTIEGFNPVTLPNFSVSYWTIQPPGGFIPLLSFGSATPGTPLTITFLQPTPGLQSLGLQSPFNPLIPFTTLLQEHPEITSIHFGYSVVSLDFIPTAVPEPATSALALIGGIAVLVRRRMRTAK